MTERTYDSADRDDFEAYAALVGRRVARTTQLSLAYGVRGWQALKLASAVGPIDHDEYAKLNTAFGCKNHKS